MPATTQWRPSQTYEFAGGEVAYEILGAGPPVVLIHGTPSWSYLWRNVAGDLAERYTVHVCDLLGYGTSEQREYQDVSIAAQTKVLAELLDLWGLEQPCVAGHDFGGRSRCGSCCWREGASGVSRCATQLRSPRGSRRSRGTCELISRSSRPCPGTSTAR